MQEKAREIYTDKKNLIAISPNSNKNHQRWSRNTSLMIVCSCHVTHAFQSESIFYSCLNVKDLLARSRPKIGSLSDCNWTPTQNHLVRKKTLDQLAKLAKWLSVPLRTKWFRVRVQLQSLALS